MKPQATFETPAQQLKRLAHVFRQRKVDEAIAWLGRRWILHPEYERRVMR